MAGSTFWGGGNTTKDYELMMEGSTAIAKPTSLVGHSLTGISPEVVERVTATSVYKERGKIKERVRTIRAARQTGVTFTVQFGSEGEMYTPLLVRARRGGLCDKMLYVKRLCAPNDNAAHFYFIEDASLNPPSFPNDLITIDETTNIVTQQSEGQAPELGLAHVLGGFLLSDTAVPYYAAAFMTEECEDCSDDVYQSILVGGGVGGGADDCVLTLTEDRFGNTTNLTTGIADGNVITSIYTNGDVILVGFSDDPAVATGATGGTAFSADRGQSFTIDVGISEPIYGVTFFEGQYIAVGGTASGDAVLYTSDDGINWTASTSDALPTGKALTAIAVDEDTEYCYITGEGGTLLKGEKTSGSIALTALTPSNVSTTALYTVAVLGEDHIAVGGASDYYAESMDGGDSWSQPSIPGSAAIYALAGRSRVRSAVGTGSVFADRTILTDNEYRSNTPKNGFTITGNVRAIASLPGEWDYFLAATDAGEVLLYRPMFPGA